MTYHTVLKTSADYIDALRNARKIGDNITSTLTAMNLTVTDPDKKSKVLPEVFPYRYSVCFFHAGS